MRILILNWRDVGHPKAGGAEKYLHEIALRWVARGHAVSWIAPRFSGAMTRETIDGIEIRRVGTSPTVYFAAVFAYLRYFRGRVDAILDSENGIPFFAPLYAREPVVAVIYHVHVRVFRSQLVWPLSEFFVWLETQVMPRVYARNRFIAISSTSRDEMLEYGITKFPIAIIYPGVDALTSTEARSIAPRISCVGRLEAYKRVDIVLRTLARLVPSYPDIHLDIAGRGNDRQRLEALTQTLGMGRHVTFHGFIDDQQKADIVAASWAFVSASSMEGWGIVAIEANAVGTPAVVFDVPGLSEAVVDGASGFVVADEAEFEAALRRIFGDADLRARFDVTARERAAAFGWDAAADRLLEVVEAATAHRHREDSAFAGVTVGLPIYNEEANLAALLDVLEADPDVVQIVGVDDGSTDRSPEILREHAAHSTKLDVASTGGGAGQLQGWIRAARMARAKNIVFIDADSLPERGAVRALARKIERTGAIVASGRVLPDAISNGVPMSRFSAAVLHNVRALGYAKEAIIGRFFCVDAAWFVATATRDDIIANDSYLSVRARRDGLAVTYAPEARCRYVGATTVADLAAQRQRADNGYAQLRTDGYMLPEDEPPARAYLGALVKTALSDPLGAAAWIAAQMRARGLRAYQVRGGHSGTWTTQASTKRAMAAEPNEGGTRLEREQQTPPMDAKAILRETWENVWATDDVEAEHRDAVAVAASENTLIFRPHVDRMLAMYDRPVLLEAGCGLGQWLYYAVETTEAEAIGLDLTETTLERVSNSATLRPFIDRGRVKLVAGDMRAIPLPDRSVDLIFSFGVIEHVLTHDSQKTVSEFYRVLKPGGRLLLATPNVWSMHSITRPVLQLARRWTVGFERSISPNGLAKYCRTAGLYVEECGVMESGTLFGAGLNSVVPNLRAVSIAIERRQQRFGFMAYTVSVKNG